MRRGGLTNPVGELSLTESVNEIVRVALIELALGTSSDEIEECHNEDAVSTIDVDGPCIETTPYNTD